MRIRTNRKAQGTVLVVAIILASIAGITLGSLLSLISTQCRLAARSQAWNSGVAVMEAGVEEALTQIHYNGCTNLLTNNWTYGADGYYHKTRSVGSDGSYCQVSIQPVYPPVIFSTACVPAPSGASNYLTRTVRVTTKAGSPTAGGIRAKGDILISSGVVDSYSSCLGTYNPAIHGANASVLSDTNTPGAVNLTSGSIYGMAVTGPGGTITTSGSAAVGDTIWIATHTGVEPGYSANDANVQFNDVAAPYTSGIAPANGPGGNGTNYTYVVNGNLNARYYVPGNLAVNGGQSMIIQGNASLYVTRNFVTSGSAFVYLAPGASLTLYVGGTFTVSGTGIVNATEDASNLSILGLPTCSTVTYSGSAAFIGTVNAPEAAFTFSGGSGAFGAFSANTVTISGSGGVHYDECLGGNSGYVVASWNEIY